MGRPIKRIETAVDKAMAELRTMGWKTGTPKDMEYDCCQGCSWGNFESGDQVLFYHEQDLDNLRYTRRENKDRIRYNQTAEYYEFREGWEPQELYQESLMLAWSGNVLEAIRILQNYGVRVKWDGTPNTRLEVMINGDPGLELYEPRKTFRMDFQEYEYGDASEVTA